MKLQITCFIISYIGHVQQIFLGNVATSIMSIQMVWPFGAWAGSFGHSHCSNLVPGCESSPKMIQLEIVDSTFHCDFRFGFIWAGKPLIASLFEQPADGNADMKCHETTSWLLNVCIGWSCTCISQDVFRMQQKLAVLGLNLKEGKDLVFLQSNEGFCIVILYGFKQLCSNLQKTLRQGDLRSRKTQGGLCFDMLRLFLSFDDFWCQYLVLPRHNPTLEFRRVEETFGNSACGWFVDGWVAMSPVSPSGPLNASIGSAVPLIIRL